MPKSPARHPEESRSNRDHAESRGVILAASGSLRQSEIPPLPPRTDSGFRLE
jgi:hypothetical protein